MKTIIDTNRQDYDEKWRPMTLKLTTSRQLCKMVDHIQKFNSLPENMD